MRKINFLFGVLAVAATGLLSSCDWSDNEADLKPNVTVPSLGENTLIVTTNVNATIEVDGQTKTGKNVTFAVAGKEATVVVSAGREYFDRTVEVNFGENTMLYVDVNLVKKVSGNQRPQSDASSSPIDNDLENQEAAGFKASITVPANTRVEESSEDFSIVAYTPAEVGKQNVNVGANVALPVLALSCTPDGATFKNEPVTLTAFVEDAVGYDVVCVNGNTVVDGDNITINANSVSAKVDHFSIWEFVLRANVTKVEENTDILLKSGSILLTEGKNTITYTQKCGFSAEANYSGLITNFLVNQFGKEVSVNKSVDITSDKVGSANYTVKQAVKTYTFKSNEKYFTAKVYGAVTVKIESTTADTSGHSGGSGK